MVEQLGLFFLSRKGPLGGSAPSTKQQSQTTVDDDRAKVLRREIEHPLRKKNRRGKMV
jgi:hypothetical protein